MFKALSEFFFLNECVSILMSIFLSILMLP